MNFFSELLSDPDKKFNGSDKDLINFISEGLFKSDPKIRLIKQDHHTGVRGDNYNQTIVSFFTKGEKKFHIEFIKVSESKKKDFSHTHEMAGDYCHFYGCETVRELEKKVKKVVGIIINIYTETWRNGNSIGVGSDDDHRNFSKLHAQAREDLPIIINWLIKNIKK